ncbi:MAG TPA: hypothetical protein VGL27_07405 [Negativicutes bacterium]
MYNYTLTRLPYLPVFCMLFAAGVTVGGLGGLALGLLEKDLLGLLNGALTGLLFGLVSGVIGVIYAIIFNILAPITGGIPLRLEATPDEPRPSNILDNPALLRKT